MIDQPRAIRTGEELDTGKLSVWLGDVLQLHGPVEVLQFPKGHSNLTYLVKCGARELVLRRPPFGSKVKTAHDMGREFRILSRLSAVLPEAPRPLAHCDDLAVLGAPFYVMERIEGVILRSATLDLAPDRVRALDEAFVDTLVRLHALDFRAAGLGELGKPDGYIRRQVEGWTKRYADAKTDDIAEVDEIAAWLAARIPPESGAALIHNDYKFDNLVLAPDDPTRIRGILDWEMSTLGDPLMDLGTALAYWVEDTDRDELKLFAFGPTFAPGSLTRRELAQRYAEKSGRDVSGILFHTCFALFKNAVVVQQIYARYKKGLTHDERFAHLIVGVQLLAQEALRHAQSGAL